MRPTPAEFWFPFGVSLFNSGMAGLNMATGWMFAAYIACAAVTAALAAIVSAKIDRG